MKSTLSIALFLAVLSGAAALSHELLWTRRLVDLLGATGEATSRVFGCFFLGLALGGLLAARVLPRIKRPWLAVALCELAIAVLAVPALCLPWWSDGIWPALGPERLMDWQGALIKTFLSAAVVLPPAVPMGMTLPFFAAAVLRRNGTMRREGIWLYGGNTLGGVVGVLVSSSFLLEPLGVEGCMAAAIVVNLAVGLGAWRLSRWPQAEGARTSTRAERKRAKAKRNDPSKLTIPLSPVGSIALSFLSGVAMLALEVLAIRMISMVVPSSFQATVGVLASVILLLAVAAIATPWLLRSWWTPRAWLLGALVAASIAASLAPKFLYQRTQQLMDVPHLAGMAGDHLATTTQFLLSVCSIALVTVGPALLVGGLVLPIVLAWSGGEGGDAQGKRFGYLLAANGVGGILGAELAQLVILPTWGIYQGFAVVGVLYALGFALLMTPWHRPSVLRWAAACAVIAIPIALGGWLQSRIPYLSPRTTVQYRELAREFGRDGVLLVVESPSRGRGILLNNQYLLGSSGSVRDERREVLLPLLLHAQPAEVCCIGVATGISAGAALDYSETCQLTAVEISSLVSRTAEKHFSEFNRDLYKHPRAQVVVEDGRTYIAASKDRFDVIVGDLYRPYGAGEGRLFSVEHFQATRRALRDGGVFCQWLPMYQLTESHFRMIAASFLQAYPDADLLLANKKTNFPMLGLLGWKQGRLDRSTLIENCARLKESDSVVDQEVLDPNIVGSMYLGRLDAGQFSQERLNTLGNARIEIVTGRRKITRDLRRDASVRVVQEPYLQGSAWTEFQQRLSEFLMQPKAIPSGE